MRTTPLYVGIAMLLGVLCAAAETLAAGRAPDSKVCNDNPPKDAVTQGGCIAIARAKGNCQACHHVPGISSGNIALSLAGVAQRIPDKSRVRAQIQDPTKTNPKTVMPPYGKHEILAPEEIEKVIEWLWTL